MFGAHRRISPLVASLGFATLALAACDNAPEQRAQQDRQSQSAVSFEGETITLYVGRTPGSGGDLAARMFAGHWQRHIPGEPTIVVRNLPGGGGTRVFNWAAEVADADGLHIVFSPTAGIEAVLEEPGLRANFAEMPFVGGLMSPNMAYVRTEQVKEPADLLTAQGLRFGGNNPIARFDLLGRLALDALGVDYQNVTGFQGGADVFNAVRRGELDIQVGSLGQYRFSIEPTLVAEGDAIPLWHNPGTNENGETYPLDVAEGIPSFEQFYEQVKGEPPSGREYEMLKWILPRVNDIVYAAIAPPGTPDDVVAVLQESFAAVTRDPVYQEEARKMYGFVLPPIGAQLGTQLMRSLYDVPDDVATFLNDYIDEVR
jgi:tripartite-type tricarboxylate transporter receptor subunit TctC